jgi:hypothetical protein
MNEPNCIRKTEDLGFAMPPIEGLETMTAEHYNAHFDSFISCDVWAADGWLVTAIMPDAVTHHLRKGTEVCLVKLDPTTLLYFKHTETSMRHAKEL